MSGRPGESPTLTPSHSRLHEAGGRGSSDGLNKQRMRAGLVVMQAALAIVLLAGAGLTLKSFWRAQNAPLGFEPHGVVNFTKSLCQWRSTKTGEERSAFWTQLLQRVQSIPGVEAAAIGSNSPFDDTENDNYFPCNRHSAGSAPTRGRRRKLAAVSPDYFRVMRMPILRGRGFGPEDLPGEKGHSRSIVIDESFAQKYFAEKGPIGEHIDDNDTLDENAPPMTIVGVVPRTRNEAPGELNVESLHLVQEYVLASQAPQPENRLHATYKPARHRSDRGRGEA